RLSRRTERGPRARVRRAPREHARLRPPRPAAPVRAEVQTAHGVYLVELDEEEVVELDADARLPPAPPVELSLPLVVAAAASGSTIVAVVDRRPPLVVSHDAGRTWREAGGGLPR